MATVADVPPGRRLAARGCTPPRIKALDVISVVWLVLLDRDSRRGSVQQIGWPNEIYDRPANIFVAGFIGSPAMNFLNGVVGGEVATTGVRGDGWELPLSPAHAARARKSNTGEVIVEARHTNLTVLPESAETGLPARIYTVEPTGDLTYIHLYLGKQLVVASAPGTYHGSADQPIQLAFDQDRLYLFDAATEQALQ